MSAPLLLLAPLLAQLGPPLPRTTMPEVDRPSRQQPAQQPPAPVPASATTREADCQVLVRSDPPAALEFAETWRGGSASMSERAAAEHCRGMAAAALNRWEEAEEAFAAARDTTPANERAARARLGLLAGNAALARGEAGRAIEALDEAQSEAIGAGDTRLNGEIAIDRARALVALGREADGAGALAQARNQVPDNAQAWLLSATLSRRQGRLVEAQAQIQRAAELLPVDPEIGLEAGVIAALSGRDEAARKSFRSVIAAAPDSVIARTAQSYLDQLGPEASSPGR